MNKRVLYLMILFILMMTLPGRAGSEDGANRLYADACQWAATAQKSEAASYAKAVELNGNALTALERIIKEYGKSTIAAKLVKGEARIGSYTFAEFKEQVKRSQQNLQWAEQNIFGTALLLVKGVGNAQEQRELVGQMIQEYWNYTAKPSAGILSVAFEVAQSIREPRRKIHALIHIAGRSSAESGEIAAILHEIERESYTDAEILVDIAELYARAGKYDRMLVRLQQAAKGTKDPELTGRIARGLALAKQYDAAAELARKFGTADEKDDALLGVIAQAAHNRDYTRAIAMSDQLAKVSSKASAWIYIAVGYAKNGNLAGALELLKTIKRPEEQLEMLHEIGYYYHGGAIADILKQIELLPDSTMKLQVLLALFENYYFIRDAGTEASSVLNRCYEIMKASRIYERNPELAAVLAQNFGLLHRADPMEECYSLFLQALGFGESAGSRVETLKQTLDDCSEYLIPDLFRKLLEQTAKFANASLSGSPARQTLNLVASHYRKLGQAAHGWEIVKAALERPWEAGAEEGVARLSVTASQCALDQGDAKRAEQMAQQAYELARKVPRYAGMRDLFEVFCDLGNIEKVKELMDRVDEYEHFYVTWVDDLLRTAAGSSRWGKGDQTVKLLEEMLTRRTDKRDPERNEILGGLAAEYARRKDYTRLRQILNEMQNEDVKVLTLAALASSGVHGDEKLAGISIELAQKLSQAGCGRALQEIAAAYVRNEKWEQGFALIETIRDPLAKSNALLQMAIGYAERGKGVDESARKHLRKILRGE